MIKFEHISFSYGEKLIFKDLNLEISPHQLTCLLGGSGSGKTTILRLIAGLETPQKGSIFIHNQIVTKQESIIISPHERQTGFIFQDLALWPHFTVFENIAFGLKQKKESKIKEKVLDMLKFFGMESKMTKYPHELSGGQQQLVAIARALVLEPKILLMDEPLSNLDVKLKRKTIEVIKNLKNNFGLTLVYVTHDHKEAFAIADEIILLNEGKIEEKGTPQSIKQSENTFTKYFLEY